MDPHKIKREPVLAQEARRETARESIRREEYERRREDADKALLMRNLRILGSANAAEEKESLRQGKMQQREKLLERTRELDAMRRSLVADGAKMKSAEQ